MISQYSIIILLRNSESVKSLLVDIAENTQISLLNNVIIVDNNSEKEYLFEIEGLLSLIEKPSKIIKLDHNFLYSYGNNVGLKYAMENTENSHFFIVNPDIRIIYRNCFNKIQNQMWDRNAGIAGAKLLFGDNVNYIEHAGGINNTHIGYGAARNSHSTTAIVEWVTGAVFGIARETIDKIGYFDHVTYPHWVSDQEYCRRAKLCGIDTLYSPVEFVHAQGKATNEESHIECWKDLPEGVTPNVNPVSLEHIKETALRNSKNIPILF
jgi:GT2 family glycosyltransferase